MGDKGIYTKILELEELIKRANIAYENGSPIITDYQYDLAMTLF